MPQCVTRRNLFISLEILGLKLSIIQTLKTLQGLIIYALFDLQKRLIKIFPMDFYPFFLKKFF